MVWLALVFVVVASLKYTNESCFHYGFLGYPTSSLRLVLINPNPYLITPRKRVESYFFSYLALET
jgi:hypothetical protein